jgi:hypothetical protein
VVIKNCFHEMAQVAGVDNGLAANTSTAKVDGPLTFGFPEMTPVDRLSLRPEGREPEPLTSFQT